MGPDAYNLGAKTVLYTLGFEKQAVVGHGLLAGLLGHLGVNTLGRMAHKNSNIASVLAAKGLEHGILESAVNPMALRSIKAIAGPEAVISYTAANSIGKRLAQVPPQQREVALRAMMDTENIPAPVLHELGEAARHQLAGSAPALQSKGVMATMYGKTMDTMTNLVDKPFDTGIQRGAKSLAGGAPLAGLLAADPIGGLAHAGVNTAREVVGNSPVGKKVMRKLFDQGVQGQTLSPAKELAIDIGISPGVLNPQRIGAGLRKVVPEQYHSQLSPANIDKGVDAVKSMIPKPSPISG